MSHLALYREFRPKDFTEVVGQEHIVKTLINQVKTGNLNHAYLFCGTRGTGKTSCAKIFAKAVNCLNSKNGSPCFECESCKAISENGNLDIIEIDAASNNRVDEIRELREKVNYLPSVGKYKVYIIDEVHMLTDSAFNALLKTLEEPPSHIIFILATTEPQKLPATILSRCMRFDFKLVSENDLCSLLKRIFERKNVKFEEEALPLIAKAGKGSVRDTLSVAEMCKAYSFDNISYNKVVECLGLTGQADLFEISKSIVEKNGKQIIEIVERLYEKGKSLPVFISDLCDYFKNLLTFKFSADFNFKQPKDVIENYKLLTEKTDAKFLLDALEKLTEAETGINRSNNEKVYTQTALISLFYNNNLEIEMLKQKVQKLESVIENGSQFIPKTTINNVSFANDNKSQQTAIKLEEIKENHLNNKNNIVALENTATMQEHKNYNESERPDFQDTTTKNPAKEVFGEFIKCCRGAGEMMLFSCLADVENVSMSNNALQFECKSKECADLIENHKGFVQNFLSQKGIENFKTIVCQDKEKQTLNELSEMLNDKLKIN